LEVGLVAKEETFELNHQLLTGALLSSMTNRARLEELGDSTGLILLNVIQFSLLFNFDLSCLLRDMRARKGTWHVKLHARHVVLTIFECVDDFLALLGKDFREVVRKTADSEAALASLNGLHKRLRLFQEGHPEFQGIRHSIAAHRDHDAAAQIRQLEGLDDSAVEQAGYEMIKWLTDLHAFTTQITKAMSNA
jgi:hypothetical protein